MRNNSLLGSVFAWQIAFGFLLHSSFFLSAANAVVQPLPSGYVYGPDDFGIEQWTPSLQLVNSFNIPGVAGMAGAGASRDGMLLTEAFFTSTSADYLLAVGKGGAIARQIALPGPGLDAGSGIVVDPSTGVIYASMDSQILEIQPDFSSLTALPVTLGRAAGLALAKDGTLYAVDQNANQIDVISSRHQLIGTIPTGTTPIGLAFAPDGSLWYTDEPYRTPTAYLSQLIRVDLANNDQQTVVQSGVPFMSQIDFAPDCSYYLGDNSGRDVLHYSSNGTFLQSAASLNITDGVAFVPEPGTFAVVSIASILALASVRKMPPRADSRNPSSN